MRYSVIFTSLAVVLVAISNLMQQCELSEHRQQIHELQQRCKP